MNSLQKECLAYGHDNYFVVSHHSFKEDGHDAADRFVVWENVTAKQGVCSGTGGFKDGWLLAACELAKKSLMPVRFEIGVLYTDCIMTREIVVHHNHAVVTELSEIAKHVQEAAVRDSLSKTARLIDKIASLTFVVGPNL